jgi:hypothetical protein
MNDSKRLVLEIDQVGSQTRVNVSVLDDENRGHGYRISGPKYVNYPAESGTKVIELDSYARAALRSMLAEVDAHE